MVEALEVGGWRDAIGLDVEDAQDANADYRSVIAKGDIDRVDGVRRDPDTVLGLLAGYARNVSTDASLRAIGASSDGDLSETTVHSHLRALLRLFLIEDKPAWSPRLRARVRLAKTPKRHLAGRLLGVTAFGATPERLLGSEIQLAGFLFELQAVHDLRVYTQANRLCVRYYRDNKGLEVDASARADCRALMVVVANMPAYVREDGVVVASIASLGV